MFKLCTNENHSNKQSKYKQFDLNVLV